ncbi:hypothetical protein, partial [Burkholderia sp. SIMBA_052]|uniref:hypothetical protein n=1 Tax=Burkholderia sp. SIMBA_052 TaxID=3085793 RepID=UPI00397ABB08
ETLRVMWSKKIEQMPEGLMLIRCSAFSSHSDKRMVRLDVTPCIGLSSPRILAPTHARTYVFQGLSFRLHTEANLTIDKQLGGHD